ncbi:MAG TPA: ATP-binding protein [Anaeromyxobacteraceae bacterium]|nr:ATP-binding protein [Anaeromyxobacteraceae bacterium]
MDNLGAGSGDPTQLRRRAEELLRCKGSAPHPSGEELERLWHDLDVHHIELEIQNDELRATQLEATQTASRYAELFDLAPVGYVTLRGIHGHVQAINLAGASLFRVERSRLVGHRFRQFFFEADRLRFDAFYGRTLDNAGATTSCELSLYHLEEPSRCHLTAKVLASTPQHVLVVIEDITEQRRREEDLKEALEILTTSQRVARLGTFVMQAATETWTSTAALDAILGIGTSFERTIENWLAIVHPDDREGMTTQLRSALHGGHWIDREYRVVHHSSGEVRSVWMLGQLQHDGVHPARLVATIQDITERQRLLQERAELLRIAQEARGAAEEASRAKDSFLATLSHELRNPLAPITNSLAILEETPPGSGQSKRAISIIRRQVRHLTRLVDDLLDLTRVARGKIQLRRHPVDLNELARSMVEDHLSLFVRSGVRLNLAPAPAPIVVDGDWDRLAQVMGNLLQNAAKFCQRGGATSLSILRDDGEKRALVQVADNGLGIAPEMLPHLFQPFMQADTSLDRSRGGGLGLGIALAKGLVELHGGKITAHSAGLGKGAEFTVYLPLMPSGATEAEQPHLDASHPRRRVLIIEDNVDAAETLRELLELRLHQVGVAYSGLDGLAKARDFRPDIVLCDIGLPGMDGYEVARAIRSDEALKGAYLIALTGYALPEDAQRASESGFQQHVAKPIESEELERILAEAPS